MVPAMCLATKAPLLIHRVFILQQSAAREKLNQLRSIESIRRMNKEAEDKENELVASVTSGGMEQALERVRKEQSKQGIRKASSAVNVS